MKTRAELLAEVNRLRRSPLAGRFALDDLHRAERALAEFDRARPVGYVTCAHRSCFATIIGREGDLCPECHAEDPAHDARECLSCDNDMGGSREGDR